MHLRAFNPERLACEAVAARPFEVSLLPAGFSAGIGGLLEQQMQLEEQLNTTKRKMDEDFDGAKAAQEEVMKICTVTLTIHGSTIPPRELYVRSWGELREQVAECGIPEQEQHPHNFDPEQSDLHGYDGHCVELISHDLWSLLAILPEKARPHCQLGHLTEIKLRLGATPQMRLRTKSSELGLVNISDTLVSKEDLDSIISHESVTPQPGCFHQGRAGVKGTLHRTTGVWGLSEQPTVSRSDSQESAEQFLLTIGASIGRDPNEIRPYIDRIVEEQWCSTIGSLMRITDEQWTQMKIPIGFVNLVQERLGVKDVSQSSQMLKGLTLRVGRPWYGVCQPIEDMIERCQSTLLLGKPGVGKSTTLREMTRLLSDTYRKIVVVVDTTNELGGFGTPHHRSLGTLDVTRLEVRERSDLWGAMLDALQNHSAQVVVIDEIRDAKEVQAARTIANQGVVLLASAHGNCLHELVHNPTLSPLIGGVESVAVSDFKMREMNATRKFIEQRKEGPAFKLVIEVGEEGKWEVHEDVAQSVDDILRGRFVHTRVVFATAATELHNQDNCADTGSTSGGCADSIDVLRPGVSKVPARLLAKLCSGAAYMCCFDGSVVREQGLRQAGSGACLFRIHSDGRKAQRMHAFDQTVYLGDATVERSEYAGLLAGTLTFEASLPSLAPFPGMLLVEGDSKTIVTHVRDSFQTPQRPFNLEEDPLLQPIFDEIVTALRRIANQEVMILIRHRPRRFNKAADGLSKDARQVKNGTFQHHLLDDLQGKERERQHRKLESLGAARSSRMIDRETMLLIRSVRHGNVHECVDKLRALPRWTCASAANAEWRMRFSGDRKNFGRWKYGDGCAPPAVEAAIE